MGFIDVEEMMEQLPAWKFDRWVAFLSIEPQGGVRGDLQAGIVASTVANVNRRKRSQPFKATDFMPQLPLGRKETQNRPQQSLSTLKTQLRAIHTAQHKRRKRQKKKRKQTTEDEGIIDE